MKTITLANGFELEVFNDDAKHGMAGKSRCFAWPGGYPMFYLDSRNNVLCSGCVDEVVADFEPGDDVRDLPVAAAVNWESQMFCDCGEAIGAAYGEDA